MDSNDTDWDKISIEDLEQFLNGVATFYEEREWPKINAVWLADLYLARLKNDLDYFVNCEGQKGYGKSNLMLLLSLLQARQSGIWQNKYSGIKKKVLPGQKPNPTDWKHIEFGFRFRNNMSFLDDVKDVKRKFNLIDKYHPFLIDEGSKNLHKYKWQTGMQFMLIKLSDTERYQNKTFYVCFPHFGELNTTFRNDRIMMRLYVYRKDVAKNYSSAIISLKDVNRYTPDPWHTDENAKLFEDILKNKPAALRNADDILYAEKRLKGYAGNFDFPSIKKICPKVWTTYMKYKMSAAKADMDADDEEEQTDSALVLKWKQGFKNMIDYMKAINPKITLTEISRQTNLSTSTLSALVNMKTEAKKVDQKAAFTTKW